MCIAVFQTQNGTRHWLQGYNDIFQKDSFRSQKKELPDKDSNQGLPRYRPSARRRAELSEVLSANHRARFGWRRMDLHATTTPSGILMEITKTLVLI